MPETVTLTPVDQVKDCFGVLYRLLAERTVTTNISHREMPSLEDHIKFVTNHPYQAWYIISDKNNGPVGSIYLTKPPELGRHGNEIGIFILIKWQRQGFAKAAISKLMHIHGKLNYFANINPANEGSIALFEALGFTHIQNTYKLTA